MAVKFERQFEALRSHGVPPDGWPFSRSAARRVAHIALDNLIATLGNEGLCEMSNRRPIGAGTVQPAAQCNRLTPQSRLRVW